MRAVRARMILRFEARFSRSRLGFFRILPAGHYWSRRDLEPEEAAHAWDICSRENDLAALLSNVPLCFIEIVNSNVVCASRNLRFLSWSYADGRRGRVLECKVVACTHRVSADPPTV